MMIKIGDRVRCYCGSSSYNGNVIDTDEVFILVKYSPDYYAHWFHIKQCRKLIKRKKYSELKVGDRVKGSYGKGKIIDIDLLTCDKDKKVYFAIVKYDSGHYFTIKTSYLKKLVKKKKEQKYCNLCKGKDVLWG